MALCSVLLSALLLLALTLVRRNTEIEHASLRQLVAETERRLQAEARAQQGQKMEALGRLTGGVAHDFNNLLAVILGSLELVLRRESDDRNIRLLTAATEAAKRGAKLTAQMLAFSRKQEIAIQPVDVNAVIRAMDEILLRTLGPRSQLHYDLATDLWPALADVTQLELALLNLAVNARDAMPDGGQVSFQTCNATAAHQAASSLAPGDYVCIVVSDTGVGMSDEVRARPGAVLHHQGAWRRHRSRPLDGGWRAQRLGRRPDHREHEGQRHDHQPLLAQIDDHARRRLSTASDDSGPP